jgi:hypothetical protein
MYWKKQNLIDKIEQSLLTWLSVSATEHNRGGREFKWKDKEIGHIHWNGDLDILFSKKIRDALLADKKVQIHKWVPDSGWTTLVVNDESDIASALQLLKLSYLQKTKKLDNQDINEELSQLNFSEAVKALI